jgi:negative regulator of replication initiation
MEYEVTQAIESIVAGYKYRFIASATNDIGESAYSSEVRFAAAALPGVPSQITRGTSST